MPEEHHLTARNLLEQMKMCIRDSCGDGTMTDDVIRLREEIALQIHALNDMVPEKGCE